MARGRGNWLAVLALLAAALGAAAAFRCERRPKDVSEPAKPVNGRFRLEFSGKDNTYVPGETYRVKLVGARYGPSKKNTFRVFTLFLEPETFWSADGGAQQVGNLSTGGDSLITFGECANTVRQTSGMLKDAVEVLWRAPPPASGCVFFRATVVEDANLWYMDDEALTLHLCEEEQLNRNRQPELQDPCCACDEAKYELTFEGLWSRHSHPKDFPRLWDTRFSDVIGASHAANYSFWRYLGVASAGLRQVAENGTTRSLEKELKDNSQHIRTIIKARGIGYPNVTGKTFAVFRVDRDHHLMSIVSHIDPSPDWFVGISGLELCLKNCSWVENIQFDLFPWDAGTNDGITYYLKGHQTWNEPIRQITSSYPNNKDSPFFDPTSAEMKPMARIYLTRQRLYEKFSCEEGGDSRSMDCAKTPYTAFGECSVTCGRGVRLQQRRYLHPERADRAGCNDTLTRRIACHKQPCPDNPLDQGARSHPRCETTDWGDWSACPPCGGLRFRQRAYKYEDAFKFCSSLHDQPSLQETLPCDPEPGMEGCAAPERLEPEEIPPHCELTHWSEWSPCSVTCGNGTRVRSRLLVARDPGSRLLGLLARRRDEGALQRQPADDEDSPPGLGLGSYDDEVVELAAATDPPDCSRYRFMQEMHCDGIHEQCDITPDVAREICRLPNDFGPCRMQEVRWFFDPDAEACKPFNYGGCRGNRNNFVSREQCEEVCHSYRDDSEPTREPLNGLPIYSLTQESDESDLEAATSPPEPPLGPEHAHGHARPIHCRVSRWGPWSECSVSCGEGYKYKQRHIEVHPKNNGRRCPKLRKKHKCRRPPCMGFDDEMQSDENPTWGEARHIKTIPGVDCVLSDWSPWSPCTKTCGSDRRQLRTRAVLVEATPGGHLCEKRIDRRMCSPIPCPGPNNAPENSGAMNHIRSLTLNVTITLERHPCFPWAKQIDKIRQRQVGSHANKKSEDARDLPKE